MLRIDAVSIFFEGVDHAECVAVHTDGSVWCGGEGGQVYRISADGKNIETVANTGGFNLGIAFSKNSEWLAICDNGNKCVWKLELKTYKLEKFADGTNSEKISIPNYAVFDKAENLYVSDSGAFRATTGKIFKFDKDGNGILWHNGPFNFTNGLALDADEKYLYVVCTFAPSIERISINDDGSAGKREVVAEMLKIVPDGLAFAATGDLYISCYAPNAIYKLDNKNKLELVIDDWEAHTLSNPTNIAFGGKNFDQLFAANLGRWHISKINLGVKGQPLINHDV